MWLEWAYGQLAFERMVVGALVLYLAILCSLMVLHRNQAGAFPFRRVFVGPFLIAVGVASTVPVGEAGSSTLVFGAVSAALGVAMTILPLESGSLAR